jgi:hypothetical protein
VRLEWLTAIGRQAFNVLHASVGGGFAPTTAIANAIHAGLATGGDWLALAAFLDDDATFTGVSLLDMRTANNSFVTSTSGGSPGLSSASPMSPATAIVVTERTARAGPGFRGRFYVPGWTEDAQTQAATVDPAAITALATWAGDVISTLAGQGMTLAIAQPARAAYTGSTGAVHAARAATTVTVTQCIVRNAFWDTQRRRGGRS